MRKLVILLALIGLILSGCFFGSSLLFMEPHGKNAINLVGNPGFELRNSLYPNEPADWFIINSDTDYPDQVALDSLVALKGSKSLKIRHSDKNLYLVSNSFKINYTGGYYIKCSVRSLQKMNKPVKVYFWAYDTAGNKKNSFHKSIKARSEWQQAEISAGFLKNPVNYARIAIFVPKDVTNTIWLDDVACYLVHQFRNE